jgi:hypothetical protein
VQRDAHPAEHAPGLLAWSPHRVWGDEVGVHSSSVDAELLGDIRFRTQPPPEPYEELVASAPAKALLTGVLDDDVEGGVRR